MLMQNLVLAGAVTLIFYHLNSQKGWYVLDDTQYALV